MPRFPGAEAGHEVVFIPSLPALAGTPTLVFGEQSAVPVVALNRLMHPRLAREQVMAVGSSAAGLLADGLVRRGVPVTTVRKRIQTVAFLGPAAALLVLANRAISPALAVACLTVALGTTSLGKPWQCSLSCTCWPLPEISEEHGCCECRPGGLRGKHVGYSAAVRRPDVWLV